MCVCLRVCMFVRSHMLADLEKSSVLLFGGHLLYQDVKSSITCSFSTLQSYTGEVEAVPGQKGQLTLP